MKTTRARLLLLATSAVASAGISTSLLAACAADENGDTREADVAVIPTTDATQDAGTEADTTPCAKDCEFFPSECTGDALCPNGPFDTTDPALGLDWRTRVNVIAGRSASDVWIAGAVGTVAHFDGTTWTVSEVGTQTSQRAFWLAPAGELTIGGVDRIYSRDLEFDGRADAGVSAGGWSRRPTPTIPSGFGRDLTAGWAAPGANAIWFGTTTDLWRLRLGTDSALEVQPGIAASVCNAIPCKSMRGIHGASASTLFAVGDVGAAVRIQGADGAQPTASPLNTQTWTGLAGVWASSDTDAWAVGGSGTIRHYTGNDLQWDAETDVPTSENLNGVWGASPTDVWAVGNAGVVLHYDGTSWSRVKVAGLGSRRPDLYSVWSPGPGHVWIGGQGIVLALGGKP